METSNVFWIYASVNMSTLVFYQKGGGRGGRKFTPLRRLINKLNVWALIVTCTAFRARKYPWLREKKSKSQSRTTCKRLSVFLSKSMIIKERWLPNWQNPPRMLAANGRHINRTCFAQNILLLNMRNRLYFFTFFFTQILNLLNVKNNPY